MIVATLRGLTVLDLSTGSLAASYATSLISTWGADTWKVERAPLGDPVRGYGPTVTLISKRKVGLPFVWTCGSKRWVGLRLETDDGDRLARMLAGQADVVVASDIETCERFPGRRATVCVSAFGSTGPRSHWKASSFGLFHAGGPGYVTPRAPQGGTDGSVKPLAPWGYVVEYFGGLYVALAILAAQFSKESQLFIDISLQECLFPLMRREMAAWLYEGYVASRYERLWKVAPSGFYAAQDGPVYLNVIEDKDWQQLCELMGRSELARDVRFLTSESRFRHLREMDEFLEGWAMNWPKSEIFEMCARVGVPAGPVNDPYDLLEAIQLRARAALQTHSVEEQAITFPALPIRLEGQSVLGQRWDDVPEVGRDTETVLLRVGCSEREVRAAMESGSVVVGAPR